MSRHGQDYVLGARAPMGNADFAGPWDCAEFCSWCVYQAAGILFGVRPIHDVMRADAYTGYWAEDSGAYDCRIPLAEALAIPGAALLRPPSSQRGGHIAFSDGRGGTSEAKGRRFGVGAFSALHRGWEYGVLVPGVRYFRNHEPAEIEPVPRVLKLSSPMMRGPAVLDVQKQLSALGHPVGKTDGIFGPQTEAAVIAFQDQAGITPDGEVGPETLAALKEAIA